MSPGRRRVMQVTALLSLLPLLALAAAWIRSYHRIDRFTFTRNRAEHSISIARGDLNWFYSPDPDHSHPLGFDSVALGQWRQRDGQVKAVSPNGWPADDVFPVSRSALKPWRLGVRTLAGKCSPCVLDLRKPSADPRQPSVLTQAESSAQALDWKNARARYRMFKAVIVPVWMLGVPLSLFPAAAGCIVWRRRRRVQAGQCAACGYDLCATPERCPECGTAVASQIDHRGN